MMSCSLPKVNKHSLAKAADETNSMLQSINLHTTYCVRQPANCFVRFRDASQSTVEAYHCWSAEFHRAGVPNDADAFDRIENELSLAGTWMPSNSNCCWCNICTCSSNFSSVTCCNWSPSSLWRANWASFEPLWQGDGDDRQRDSGCVSECWWWRYRWRERWYQDLPIVILNCLLSFNRNQLITNFPSSNKNCFKT